MNHTKSSAGTQHSARGTRPRDRAAAALCVGAVLLAGLLAAQVSRLVGGAPAMADLVASSTESTVLTVDAGSGEDVVVVLDQRAESLMLYRCMNQRSLDLKGIYDLRQLFFEAKRAGR